MQSYQDTYTVKWHEIDAQKKLRYYAFMNMAQEVSNVHSEAIGFGYKELIMQNEFWALSRVKIEYINPPKWGDKVSLQTWHKGKQGPFWIRDYALYNSNGEITAVATSSWVIMNIQTRRIERKTIFDNKPEVLQYSLNKNAIEKACEKINLPQQELKFVRNHTVMYSDIDFNLHANNAKYIEWIMDSISLETLKTKDISSLQINYISEARYADEIKISLCYSDEQTIYLQGERDNNLVFQALLEIKDKKNID